MPPPPPRPELLLRAQLQATGITDDQIRAEHRASAWTRVRRGAYLPTAEWAELGPESRGVALIRSTVPRLAERSVLSHTSAALWHGLPVLGSEHPWVHVTAQRSSGGFRRGRVHSHVGHLLPGDATVVNAAPVTTVARTLLDCACTLSFDAAVVVGDAALHRMMVTGEELAAILHCSPRRRGLGQARRVFNFLDPRAESPGESLSRVRIAEAGLPAPVTQFVVVSGGRELARVDFAWEAFRTIGEFDGRIKYTSLVRPGEDVVDVMTAERRREQEVLDAIWQPVRWGWADVWNFDPVAVRLRRAFDRGTRLG